MMTKFTLSFLLLCCSYWLYGQQLACGTVTGCIESFGVCKTDVHIPFPDTLGFCETVDITITTDMPNFISTQNGVGVATDVPPGTYTVVYDAIDNCGNMAVSCETTATVFDCKLPVPFCDYNIEFYLSGNPATVTVEASQLNAGSFDNCTAPEDLLYSFSADTTDTTMTFDVNDVGFQEVLLWVTDESGNQDFCYGAILILSVAVNCENIQTCILGDDCVANVSIPTIATASCDNLAMNFTSDIPDLSLNPDGSGMTPELAAGIYSIDFEFSDDCSGNFCNLMITVEDCEAPMMSCQDMNISFADVATNQTIIAKQLDNGSTDNCTTASNLQFSFSEDLADTIRTFSCANVGNNDVTLIGTDEAGVQGFCTASIVVEHTPAFTINQQATFVSCFGEMDGSIDLTVTGLPPISFNWDNGATSEDISNLPAGNYQVTVTEGCGILSNTLAFTIDEPDMLSVFDTIITHPTNSTTTDGSIILEVAGGAFPYTYNWSNGDTSNVIVGLPMGDYQVTVTDINGCELEVIFTLDGTTETNRQPISEPIKLVPNIRKRGMPVRLITDFQKREITEIQYLNMAGKNVGKEVIIVEKGKQYHQLTVPKEEGIYLVAITKQNGQELQIFKLVIL